MAEMTQIWLQLLSLLLISGCAVGELNVPDDWSFQAETGSLVSLQCNSSDVIVEAATDLNIKWFKTVSQDDIGTEVIDDGEEFKIREFNSIPNGELTVNVSEHTRGVYVCMVYYGDTFSKQITRGINYHESPYSTKLDKYKGHIILGAIAAAVCLGLFVGLCFIYKCRYKSDEDRQRQKEWNMKLKGLHNDGYVGEEKKSFGPTHL